MFARLADRRKRAQPLRETLRKRGSVQFRRLRGSGKEQTRLEEREPRRHDQIVGGKLEAQFARGLDEEQILFGQREDGNARQVDPLPAGKLQQQVKRAFETIEVDGERGLARRLSEVEIATKPIRCQRITSSAHGGAPAGVRQGRPKTRLNRRAAPSGLKYMVSNQAYIVACIASRNLGF